MLFCHEDNQAKFALFVKQLITKLRLDKSAASISGFLHQLIIQVLLDDQTILVNFQRKSSLFKTACNSSLGLLTHPRFGTGNNCRLVELPLTKTCAQLTQLISDVPLAHMLSGSSPKSGESMNENVLEMKELLSKFKNFASDSFAESSSTSAPKNGFKSEANVGLSQAKGQSTGSRMNIGLPKLKLFLKGRC